MFHCSACEKGKTQLGIALQYPSVYIYVTLYYFFKSGKVNGGDLLGVAGSKTVLVGAGFKMAVWRFLSFVSICNDEVLRQLS